MRLAYSSALAAALLAATLFCADLIADPSLRLVSGDPEGGDALAAGSWKATLGFYGDSPASQSKRGSAYDLLVAEDQGAYEGALRQASEARPDLVVAAGARFAGAVDAAAAQYPDQNYLLIGGRSDKPNVMCASLGEAEAAYLSGLAAGLKANASKIPAPRFGFMGSEPGPEATALEARLRGRSPRGPASSQNRRFLRGRRAHARARQGPGAGLVRLGGLLRLRCGREDGRRGRVGCPGVQGCRQGGLDSRRGIARGGRL